MLNWKYTKPIEGTEIFDNVASKAGVILPNEYKELARMHNGGRPDKKIFTIKTDELSMRRLLRIDSEGSENILEQYLRLLEITTELFPFADDSFGNLFCFKQVNHQEPIVVFFNHETESIQEIAPSFTIFLHGLHS